MELTNELEERYELATERILEIPKESLSDAGLTSYFHMLADLYAKIREVYVTVKEGELPSLAVFTKWNDTLYADILPAHYAESFGNPDYASEKLGDGMGPVLSMLYAELRGAIRAAYEDDLFTLTVLSELFLSVYGLFTAAETDGDIIKPEAVSEEIRSHMLDYTEEFLSGRTIDTLIGGDKNDRYIGIIRDAAASGEPVHLYRYGEYVTANELSVAEYLWKLPAEKIECMAETFVNGFVEGYRTMRIDLAPKKYVAIRYAIGFERMIAASIDKFRSHGLSPVIYGYPVSRLLRRLTNRVGFTATPANKQYEYDHRMDEAVFIDKAICNRKLEVLAAFYEAHAEEVAAFAGPAVMETFGEDTFAPAKSVHAITLSEEQNKMILAQVGESAELSNRFMPRDKYSFTIIAFPIPEIGPEFSEIFDEVIRVNTLDNATYRQIQQSIIDCLDRATHVEVRGCGKNHTDIRVMLRKIDREKETNFENCVADVNIPVGEVFTSPELSGTEGTLHVSSVYLNDLRYDDLLLTFVDGCVKDYACANFEDPAEGRKFIEENLLFGHPTLPIGEFAIGTNTTAYRMARKFDILAKLPILIGEKTGPHFALGDTCYSYSEEARLFNPDGKEIVAKDNAFAREKKYFNCHTDITIPYDELGSIVAVCEDGTRTDIIRDGRFVLPGTEKLNEPLKDL